MPECSESSGGNLAVFEGELVSFRVRTQGASKGLKERGVAHTQPYLLFLCFFLLSCFLEIPMYSEAFQGHPELAYQAFALGKSNTDQTSTHS